MMAHPTRYSLPYKNRWLLRFNETDQSVNTESNITNLSNLAHSKYPFPNMEDLGVLTVPDSLYQNFDLNKVD